MGCGKLILNWETMQKASRIILGIAVMGLVLHMADLATRDCRLAPYVYDDCMWIGLRTHLGLPASRFLRMAVLEGVGIVLALDSLPHLPVCVPFSKSDQGLHRRVQ